MEFWNFKNFFRNNSWVKIKIVLSKRAATVKIFEWNFFNKLLYENFLYQNNFFYIFTILNNFYLRKIINLKRIEG